MNSRFIVSHVHTKYRGSCAMVEGYTVPQDKHDMASDEFYVDDLLRYDPVNNRFLAKWWTNKEGVQYTQADDSWIDGTTNFDDELGRKERALRTVAAFLKREVDHSELTEKFNLPESAQWLAVASRRKNTTNNKLEQERGGGSKRDKDRSVTPSLLGLSLSSQHTSPTVSRSMEAHPPPTRTRKRAAMDTESTRKRQPTRKLEGPPAKRRPVGVEVPMGSSPYRRHPRVDAPVNQVVPLSMAASGTAASGLGLVAIAETFGRAIEEGLNAGRGSPGDEVIDSLKTLGGQVARLKDQQKRHKEYVKKVASDVQETFAAVDLTGLTNRMEVVERLQETLEKDGNRLQDLYVHLTGIVSKLEHRVRATSPSGPPSVTHSKEAAHRVSVELQQTCQEVLLSSCSSDDISQEPLRATDIPLMEDSSETRPFDPHNRELGQCLI